MPVFTSVGGLEQAALFVRSPQRTTPGDVDDVGVLGVNYDTAHVAGLLEPLIRPALAAVIRSVDAVAPGDAPPVPGLARAQPHDVGVGRSHGHRAQRRRAPVFEDRIPGDTPVGCLPHAAGGGGDVEGVGLMRHAGDVGDATAGERRADLAPLQRGELIRGHLSFAGLPPGGRIDAGFLQLP